MAAKQDSHPAKAKTSPVVGSGTTERTPWSRRKKITVIIIVVAVLVIVGGGAWWLTHRSKPEPKVRQEDIPYLQDLNSLLGQKTPTDPLEKAFYYSHIANDYQSLRRYDSAIDYYNRAQSTLDQNNLTKISGFVYYRDLGDAYKAKGDKGQAKTYYQKELDFLQTYKQQNPDDADGANKVTQDVQAELNKL